MRKLVLDSLGILIFVAPASAQDRPVSINVGAGVLLPLSGLNDAFNTGWNGGIGATFNVSPTFGLQAEYMYNWMPGPEKTIFVSPDAGRNKCLTQLIESNHNMHTVTFNAIYASPRTAKVGGYGLGGLGYLSSDGTTDVARRRLHDGLRSVLVLLLSGGGGG